MGEEKKMLRLVAAVPDNYNTKYAVLEVDEETAKSALRRMTLFGTTKEAPTGDGLAYLEFWDCSVQWYEHLTNLPENAEVDYAGDWCDMEAEPDGTPLKTDADRMLVCEDTVYFHAYDHYADYPVALETPPLGKAFFRNYLNGKEE